MNTDEALERAFPAGPARDACEALSVAIAAALGLNPALTARFFMMAGMVSYMATSPSPDSLEDDDATDERLTFEAVALGRVMRNGANVEGLSPEAFSDPWHKIVCMAAALVWRSGKMPDPVTVSHLVVVPHLCAGNPLPMLVEMAGLADLSADFGPSTAYH